MKGIFITGVTGNLGSRLAYEYLTQTDAKLYLPVRADSIAAAKKRVAEILDFWGLSYQQYDSRLCVYPGDVIDSKLGIDESLHSQITQDVQIVIHAASSLRLDLTWEQAQQQIVGATQNVFNLFKNLRHPERFVYISTMEIMGRYPGIIKEEFLTDLPIEFLYSYEQAKFESEKYLQQCIQTGAPITIFRPSMIVGETTTGRIPKFQSFYMAFEKLILDPDFPVLPKGALIDMIPVDFLAQSIVKLVQSPESQGRIYHFSQGLNDRKSISQYEAIALPVLQRKGIHLKPRYYIWAGWYRALLRLLAFITFGQLQKSFKIRLIFLEFFGLNWFFDNQRTQQDMLKLGLLWPKVQDYLPILLEYYLQHRDSNRLPF